MPPANRDLPPDHVERERAARSPSQRRGSEGRPGSRTSGPRGSSGTSVPGSDPKGMDIPLLILGALLVATLTAFFLDILPYPIGWIILALAVIGRLIYLRSG